MVASKRTYDTRLSGAQVSKALWGAIASQLEVGVGDLKKHV